MASGPSPRWAHAMAYDAARGVTVLFGGRHSDIFNDTWEWNGTTWTQRSVSGPSRRYYHAMAYDSARGVTVLFGGYDDNTGDKGDTWEWDGTTWTSRAVSGPAPSPRRQHAMAYDASRGVTVLFGGTIGGGVFLSDTWEWDGTTWTQRVVSGPPAHVGHEMAYDVSRGVTVLFGGYQPFSVDGETWEWNGAGWAQPAAISGPSPRQEHVMAYDAGRGLTVLFGGTLCNGCSSLSGETWVWNGGIAWTQKVGAGPSPRAYAKMAYDSARYVSVLFGGIVDLATDAPSGETWELSIPVVYVNRTATGANNGGSWSDAFTELRSALTFAATHPGIHQIWVAAGTYKPAGPGGSRSASFQLQNNLAIYGGFAGTETDLTQRNIATNPSILSGDLNGDDNGDLNRADNSAHVISATNSNSTAVLDGFTITAGYANDPAAPNPGLGACAIVDASPTINNCTFVGNTGSVGAAIGCSSSSPSISSCTFVRNRAIALLNEPSPRGGAINSFVGSPILRDCVFQDNSAEFWGGACSFTDGGSPALLRCSFIRNSVSVGNTNLQEDGGAVSIQHINAFTIENSSFLGNSARLASAIGYVGDAAVSISDCLFVGNASNSGFTEYGGTIFTYSPVVSVSFVNCTLASNVNYGSAYRGTAGISVQGRAALANGVLWGNAIESTQDQNAQVRVLGSGGVITASTIQGWLGDLGGSGNNGLNPLFIRSPAPGPDGLWGTTDDDYGDLRLSPGSPAIDSGNSAALPLDAYDIDRNGNTTESLPIDLLGFPRFIDDPAAPNTGVGNPPVDRGCYESQVNCLTCPGPREWRSPSGGAWDFPGNWFPSIPQPTHDTIFNLASAYTITLPTAQSVSTNSATFSKGAVTVDLKADTWSLTSTVDTSLILGDTSPNSAALSLTNSSPTTGALAAVNTRVGSVAGASGTLTISGSHTSFTTTRSICVGCDGAGLMTVSSGAAALSRDATIGDQPGSYGYVQVTGAGSHWDIPFFLVVDHGELNVSNGGVVNAGFGVYLFDEGTISGNGTLNGNVVNFGAISPGNSPGTLTINGTYQQVGEVVGLGNVSGQLHAQAAGASMGQYDKLIVNGAATLGGGLSVSLLNNYVPATADQLQLVTATGGLTKPFDVVFFPAITAANGTTPSDKYFRAAYSGLRGPGSGSVTVNLGTLPVSPTFSSPQQFILDNPPSTIAIGDLNGDNLNDVAITIPDPINPTSSTGVVVVLFNQGGVGPNWQGFAPHLPGDPTTIPPIPVGINPKAAAITALSTSGNRQLLVANSGSNSVSILRLAANVISTVATQPTDPEPVGLTATDFAGLGNRSDIVVVACAGGAAASTGSMTMFANTSSGPTISFIRRNIPAPQGHKPINPRPFNPDQDKDIDLAVVMHATDGSPDILAVYVNGLNPGAPAPVPDLFNTNSAATTVPVGSNPVQTLAGKLARVSATNPAGKKEDVITINSDGNSISVVINTSAAQDAPTFAPAVEYHFDVTGTTASSPLSGAAVDLDGSGTLDIAVVASNPSGTNRVVKLLRNDSTENLGVTQVAFAQMPDLNAGSKPLAIVAGDVDGDGQPDLVTINSTLGRDSPNTLQIVRNALPAPAQTIGACCYGSSCLVVQAAQCGASGQRFSGFGSACNAPGNGHIPCCKGDYDQNGAVAISDIFSFLNAWFAGSPQADADDNGVLAIADIFSFLNAWFGGC